MVKYQTKKVVKKQLKPSVVYTLFIILIVISVILAYYFTTRRVDDQVVADVTYEQESSINYRVFYEENQFYDEIFMEEGGTYVSSLIDEIEIDYNYYTYFNKKINGTYTYDINARLVVWNTNQDEIWTKDFVIKDDRAANFQRKKDYLIEESVVIDFKEYKDIYLAYKNEQNIATEAILYISMNVDNTASVTGLNDIDYDAKLEIRIPISDNTFKIDKVSDHKVGKQTVSKTKSDNLKKVYSMLVAVILWVLVIVFSALLFVTYNRNVKKQGNYIRRLRKILSTYDSIIVNVKELPRIEGLSVVKVVSFEELVDAQNEVRLPINFKEDKVNKVAKFILVRNNLAWVYTLREEDLGNE